MFALVRFDDGVFYICRQTRITSKSTDTCCVKYTDGGRYPARIIKLSDDQKYLKNLKQKKESLLTNAKTNSANPAGNIIPKLTARRKKVKRLKLPLRPEIMNDTFTAEGPTLELNDDHLENLNETKEPLHIATNKIPANSTSKKRKPLSEDNRNITLKPLARNKKKAKQLKRSTQPQTVDDTSTTEVQSNEDSHKLDSKKKHHFNGNNKTFTLCLEKLSVELPSADPEAGVKHAKVTGGEVTVNSTAVQPPDMSKQTTPQLAEMLTIPPDEMIIITSACSESNATHIPSSNSSEVIINTPTHGTNDATHITSSNTSEIIMETPTHSTNDATHIPSANTSDTFTNMIDAAMKEVCSSNLESALINMSAPLNNSSIQSHSKLDGSIRNLQVLDTVLSNDSTIVDSTFEIDLQCKTAATSTPQQENQTIEESEADDTAEEGGSSSGSEYHPPNGDSDENESNDHEDDEDIENRAKNTSSVKQRRSKNSSQNFSGDISSFIEPKVVRDDADMFVVTSGAKRGQDKRTFCMYCQKMQCKFARHLETVHNDVPEVKAFSILPKKTAERKKIIDTIRKNCNFFFNTNNNVNDGELIVCRRPQARLNKKASDFQVCHHCKGFFSKNNIRHHARQCYGYNGTKNRSLIIMGRKIVAHIHDVASKRLIDVFSVLREDYVVRLIRYDRLLILYGNKLCRKYKGQHDGDMIRAHLRMLGRFLSALKEINPDVTEFASLYDPKYYDDVLLAINVAAEFDEKTQIYVHPSVAYNLGSFIKKIGNMFITDCIKRHDNVQKANTEDFLKLVLDDIGVSVNKTVMESQTQMKRRKKTELPSVDDIQKLLAYINEKRTSAYQSLLKEFSLNAWMTLAQTTLTSIQVFNRRRAGEIERVYIEDFENHEGIDKDLLKTLSAEAQLLAKKYVRFVIRGKLNRTVPVLLSSDFLACIKLLLKYRNQAGVPPGNRYVFGIPGFEKKRYKYLRACYLLRKFAKESGIRFPAKLTGTKLRKHVATNCINLNLSENEIADVANFMGHAEKIHREHYRQPIVSREILRMSKVLELAQAGVGNEEESDGSADNNDELADSNFVENHGATKKQRSKSSRTIATRHRKTRNVAPAGQQSDETHNTSEASDDVSVDSLADESSSEEENVRPGIKRKTTEAKTAKKVKKRSTSPYGHVKKKPRWSAGENAAAFELFGNNITSGTYPSLKTIQSMCSQYPCLAQRSPSVIKTWISNKIKKSRL